MSTVHIGGSLFCVFQKIKKTPKKDSLTSSFCPLISRNMWSAKLDGEGGKLNQGEQEPALSS